MPDHPQPEHASESGKQNTADSTAAQNSSSTTHWKNQIIVAGVMVGLLVGGYLGYRYFRGVKRQQRPEQAQPVTVTAAAVETDSWSRQLTAVGSLEAPQGVDVTASLGGKVVSIEFESGDRVRMGDLLIRQDTSSERAELRATQSKLEQAERDLDRAERLVEQRAITEEEYEQLATEVESLTAQAAQQRATIDKKQIAAPFTGMLGISRIDVGEFLEPGTAIVTLQQLDPIYVNFDVPEQKSAIVESGQTVTISVGAFPEKTFNGHVTAVNPLIDESTRSVTVQATLPNPKLQLIPGMFADVTVRLRGARQVTTVPETAVTFNAYGESVYVIREKQQDGKTEKSESSASSTTASNPQLVAKQSFVETGERQGLRIEVKRGLTPGERVVTAGQMKLDDGSPVRITKEDISRNVPQRPSKP